MPREGYINLTLRKSVRNRLAKIARCESRTMTEELEQLLQEKEAALGIKGARPAKPARSASATKSATTAAGSRRKGR